MTGLAAINAGLTIDRALQINGWMEPVELGWLAEQAQLHSRIVEIGSFMGRSTRALADNTAGWVVAFDSWRGPRDVFVYSESPFELGERQVKAGEPVSIYDLVGPAGGEKLFATFKENLADLLAAGKVRILQGDHSDESIIPVEFLQGTDAEKPDMVFIDGDHNYENCKRDILIWRSRLAEGGLLCGHDIDWDGVLDAVQELVPKWEVVPFTHLWRALA
jgi:hypothetical protein